MTQTSVFLAPLLSVSNHTYTHVMGGSAPVVVAGSNLRGATFAQLDGRRRPVGASPDVDVDPDKRLH